MKLKRILAVMLSLALAMMLAACSAGTQTPAATDATPAQALTGIVDTLYSGIDDLPKVGNTELGADNFEYYAFVSQPEGAEGLASEAMINAVAHSLVLVRVTGDAETVAAEIEKNANPRKWICVEAEKTIVKRKGNLIMLVMSSEATADAIAANFDKLS